MASVDPTRTTRHPLRVARQERADERRAECSAAFNARLLEFSGSYQNFLRDRAEARGYRHTPKVMAA